MSPSSHTSASRSFTARLLPVAVTAGVVASFLAVAAIGNAQARRGVRVLAVLEPLIELVRTDGTALIHALGTRSHAVGWVVTAAVASIALLGIGERRRALPLVALAAAIALASWGQILLFDDRIAIGAALYVAGLMSAVAAGVARPMRRVLGGGDGPPAGAWRRWEYGAVFALTFVALLLRAYALNELPAGFDHETIGAMIRSRLPDAIRVHLHESFLTTAPGLVHVPTQFLMFELFGTSVYSIRLAALAWGVAAIPLFYALARRLAGPGAAVATTMLFVASPESLFWSRTENTFFAPVFVCALVTAYLSLRLVERPSAGAAVAVALWMPACRYFYLPAMVLVALPLLLYAHALLFAPGARRRAWLVAPVLAGGLALFVFNLSLLYSSLDGWSWRFVHPAFVYGAPAWRKLGEEAFRQADTLELVRLQASLIGSQMAQVVKGVVYDGPDLFTHWLSRAQFSFAHRTLLTTPLSVAALLGLGYLLGQPRDRRSAALLLWIGLALLPGLMSNSPAARRIALLFPAVYLVAGVAVVAFLRVAHSAGRAASIVATIGASGFFAVATIVGLASHFLLLTAPVVLVAQSRFVAPLFEPNHLILTDIVEPRHQMTIVFDHLDAFRKAKPCYQSFAPGGDLLRLAVHPHCDFGNLAYELALTAPERNALRGSFVPRRVTFLLAGLWKPSLDAGRIVGLYPDAETRTYENANDPWRLTAVTVDAAAIAARQRPLLLAPPDQREELARGLLAGLPLRAADAPAPDGGIVVRGGLFVGEDDSYRYQTAPPCPAAAISIDGRPASTQAVPVASGLHSLELRLPPSHGCPLPLRIERFSVKRRNLVPLEVDAFTAPEVVPLALAPAVEDES